VRRSIIILLAAGLLLAGASGARADHPLAREDVQPGVEPQVFNIDLHNARMKAAVQKARRTVGFFIKALKAGAAGDYDFEVKKPFRQGDVVEHLWLSNVQFRGNRFDGYVDNIPRMIKGLKMGDHVSVNPDEISDWAFVRKGVLVGGYTIRVLYLELSRAGRAALEKEARFHIGS
jgi:uncharacterized protein YegJ (DUF2314 family)